nr:MAG: non-structural polyprotein [Avian associated calicivirus 1]
MSDRFSSCPSLNGDEVSTPGGSSPSFWAKVSLAATTIDVAASHMDGIMQLIRRHNIQAIFGYIVHAAKARSTSSAVANIYLALTIMFPESPRTLIDAAVSIIKQVPDFFQNIKTLLHDVIRPMLPNMGRDIIDTDDDDVFEDCSESVRLQMAENAKKTVKDILDQIKDVSPKNNLLELPPMLQTIIALVMMAMTAAGFTCVSSKIDCAGFLKTIADLSNVLRNWTSAKGQLANLTDTIMEAFCALVGKEYVNPKLAKVRAISNRVLEFREYLNKIMTSMKCAAFHTAASEDITDLNKLMSELREIVAQLTAEEQSMYNIHPVMATCWTVVESIRNIRNNILNSTVGKQEPVVIWIGGATNIGKSTLMAKLCIDLAKRYGFSKYTYTPSDKYWSNYHGQSIIEFDDINQRADSSDHDEFLRCTTSAACGLNMAKCEEKGTQFISKIVLCTANTLYFSESKVVKTVAALNRRRDLVIYAHNPAVAHAMRVGTGESTSEIIKKNPTRYFVVDKNWGTTYAEEDPLTMSEKSECVCGEIAYEILLEYIHNLLAVRTEEFRLKLVQSGILSEDDSVPTEDIEACQHFVETLQVKYAMQRLNRLQGRTHAPLKKVTRERKSKPPRVRDIEDHFSEIPSSSGDEDTPNYEQRDDPPLSLRDIKKRIEHDERVREIRDGINDITAICGMDFLDAKDIVLDHDFDTFPTMTEENDTRRLLSNTVSDAWLRGRLRDFCTITANADLDGDAFVASEIVFGDEISWSADALFQRLIENNNGKAVNVEDLDARTLMEVRKVVCVHKVKLQSLDGLFPFKTLRISSKRALLFHGAPNTGKTFCFEAMESAGLISSIRMPCSNMQEVADVLDAHRGKTLYMDDITVSEKRFEIAFEMLHRYHAGLTELSGLIFSANTPSFIQDDSRWDAFFRRTIPFRFELVGAKSWLSILLQRNVSALSWEERKKHISAVSELYDTTDDTIVRDMKCDAKKYTPDEMYTVAKAYVTWCITQVSNERVVQIGPIVVPTAQFDLMIDFCKPFDVVVAQKISMETLYACSFYGMSRGRVVRASPLSYIQYAPSVAKILKDSFCGSIFDASIQINEKKYELEIPTTIVRFSDISLGMTSVNGRVVSFIVDATPFTAAVDVIDNKVIMAGEIVARDQRTKLVFDLLSRLKIIKFDPMKIDQDVVLQSVVRPDRWVGLISLVMNLCDIGMTVWSLFNVNNQVNDICLEGRRKINKGSGSPGDKERDPEYVVWYESKDDVQDQKKERKNVDLGDGSPKPKDRKKDNTILISEKKNVNVDLGDGSPKPKDRKSDNRVLVHESKKVYVLIPSQNDFITLHGKEMWVNSSYVIEDRIFCPILFRDVEHCTFYSRNVKVLEGFCEKHTLDKFLRRLDSIRIVYEIEKHGSCVVDEARPISHDVEVGDAVIDPQGSMGIWMGTTVITTAHVVGTNTTQRIIEAPVDSWKFHTKCCDLDWTRAVLPHFVGLEFSTDYELDVVLIKALFTPSELVGNELSLVVAVFEKFHMPTHLYESIPSKFRVANISLQSSIDPTLNLFMESIQPAYYRVYGENGGFLCYALNVVKNYFLTVAHVAGAAHYLEGVIDTRRHHIQTQVKIDVERDLFIFSVAQGSVNGKSLLKRFMSRKHYNEVLATRATNIPVCNQVLLSERSKIFTALMASMNVVKKSDLKGAMEYCARLVGFISSGVSSDGLCGSAVMLMNSCYTDKIMGIHRAGSAASSFFAPVTSDYIIESIQQMQGVRLECAEGYMLRPTSDYDLALVPRVSQTYGVDILGTVSRPRFVGNSTKLHATGLSFDHPVEPSVMTAADPRWKDDLSGFDTPLQKSFAKYTAPKPPPDVSYHAMIEATMEIADFLVQVLQSKGLNVRTLTLDEAINGAPALEYPAMRPLDGKGSVGFPYTHRNRGRNLKRDYLLELDGRRTFMPDDESQQILRDTNLLFQDSMYGTYQNIVHTANLKDELLPVRKTRGYDIKTRTFFAGPMHYLLVFRRLFSAGLARITEVHEKIPIKVGINPDAMGWTELYRYMTEVGMKGFDADFKGFDSTISPMLMSMPIRIWNYIYARLSVDTKDLEHMKLARETIHAYIEGAHVLLGDQVMKLVGRQISGQPATAVDNSFCVWIMYVMAWKQCMRDNECYEDATFSSFCRHVRLAIYGDDNVCTVADDFLDLFTFSYVQAYFRRVGMEMSTADKEVDMADARSIEDLTFLKRTFVMKEGYCMGSLPIEACLKSVSWVHSSPAYTFTGEWPSSYEIELLQANVDGTMPELARNGEDVYNRYANEIRDQCASLGIELRPLPSWRDALAEHGY